jgi:hypothetical protein
VHRMANGRLASEDRNAGRVTGPTVYLVVIMVTCTFVFVILGTLFWTESFCASVIHVAAAESCGVAVVV